MGTVKYEKLVKSAIGKITLPRIPSIVRIEASLLGGFSDSSCLRVTRPFSLTVQVRGTDSPGESVRDGRSIVSALAITRDGDVR